jgi:hypothetical protein
MMHLFLADNRAELITRCRDKVAARALPGSTTRELDHGISVFLDQLIKTLQVERTSDPMRSREVSGPTGGGLVGNGRIRCRARSRNDAARLHRRRARP